MSLFDDPTLSDVKIHQVHEGKTIEYHGHRAILISASEWFSKAFRGPFSEATSPITRICDDEPSVFRFMLRFMYGHAYDEEGAMDDLLKGNKLRKNLLSTHLKIYAIAQKYFVTKLIKEAEDNLATTFGRCPVGETLDAVPAYYAVYGAGTKAGLAIARTLVSKEYVSPRISTLVVEYPVLAVDITLETLRLKRFPPAANMTCNYCRTRATVRIDQADDYEGRCNGCGKDEMGWTLDMGEERWV